VRHAYTQMIITGASYHLLMIKAALRNGGVSMSSLFEILIQLISNARVTWNRLGKSIDKGTIRLVYITLTLLFVFETIFVSLVIALIFLRSF